MDKDDKDRENSILKLLPGGGDPNAIKNLIRVYKNFFNDNKDMMEMMRLNAQLRKMKYDASVNEGFSKEEALKICIETKQWE